MISVLSISIITYLIIRNRKLNNFIKTNGITYRKKNKYPDNKIGAYLGELTSHIEHYQKAKQKFNAYPSDLAEGDLEKCLRVTLYDIREILRMLRSGTKTEAESKVYNEFVENLKVK